MIKRTRNSTRAIRAAALLLALPLMSCEQRPGASVAASPTEATQPGEMIPETLPSLPAARWQEFAKQRGFESASSAEQAQIWEEFRSTMRDSGVTPAQAGNLAPTPRDALPPPASPQVRTYRGTWSHGYSCTVDCSGHEAGYQWAEDNDITDPDDCSGNSTSFIEGCQAYAEENASPDSE